jgi:hypothetical protein
MFKDLCPRLNEDNHIVSSGQSEYYNCVAWAAHSEVWVIWPDDDSVYAWPPDMPRKETIDNFVTFFARIGFSVCTSLEVENGFEKIAIYADVNGPQHIARQLADGKWTSKLGELADIEHVKARDVGGGKYGEVVVVMKRRTDGTAPRLPPLHPIGIVV